MGVEKTVPQKNSDAWNIAEELAAAADETTTHRKIDLNRHGGIFSSIEIVYNVHELLAKKSYTCKKSHGKVRHRHPLGLPDAVFSTTTRSLPLLLLCPLVCRWWWSYRTARHSARLCCQDTERQDTTHATQMRLRRTTYLLTCLALIRERHRAVQSSLVSKKTIAMKDLCTKSQNRP